MSHIILDVGKIFNAIELFERRQGFQMMKLIFKAIETPKMKIYLSLFDVEADFFHRHKKSTPCIRPS